ncbi:MAG: hypothetical protein H7X92_14345 [Chitinophagales bacterium]|nr:hypothetical protein [Hyphomicrobiales bacterium]
MAKDILGHPAKQHLSEARVSLATHDEQVAIEIICGPHHRLGVALVVVINQFQLRFNAVPNEGLRDLIRRGPRDLSPEVTLSTVTACARCSFGKASNVARAASRFPFQETSTCSPRVAIILMLEPE